LIGALTGSRGNLIVAGLAPTPDDDRRPVELIVRTLTADQEADIRRSMHSTFVIRSVPQLVDQRAYLRPQMKARLGEAARFILDV
jgi:hypothetical protein